MIILLTFSTISNLVHVTVHIFITSMVGCKCWHALEKVSGSKEQDVSRKVCNKEHTDPKLALQNIAMRVYNFFYFEEKKRVYLISKDVF